MTLGDGDASGRAAESVASEPRLLSQLDPEFVLRLSGYATEEKPLYRGDLFDELESRIPKDPQVKVRFYIGEVYPRGRTAWHYHNALLYTVVIQGTITIEFQDRSVTYRPGDVFAEPMGVVHRGYNASDEIPMVGIAQSITSPHLDHTVSVKDPW